MDNVTQITDELPSFMHANMNAITRSTQIWVAGMQAISKAMTEMMQAQTEHAMATLKALAAVKSPKEAMEIQGNHTQAYFAHALMEGRKINDASVKLAEESMAPMKDHMARAMEKMSVSATAPLNGMSSHG